MLTDAGYDADTWRDMATQLGLQGLHIPEEYGGQGFGLAELCLAMEQMGKVLLSSPFFSTVCLAATALMNIATPAQCEKYLPSLADGTRIAALAFAELGQPWGAEGVAMTYRALGDRYSLTGSKAFVLDGGVASLILVVARRPGSEGEEGISLFVVDGEAAGLSRNLLPVMDLTRKQADLSFVDVEAELLGPVDDAWRGLQRTMDQAVILLANEMVGGAQQTLELSVDYAKTRVQFGRPIGAFQAIKHRCADMYARVEAARAVAYHASTEADDVDPAGLALTASLAKALCSEAFMSCARDNLQIHGGIGFTWEGDAHLFLKRAKWDELYLGDPYDHRARLAALIGI